MEDREYVLKAARTLLQYCDGALSRDEQGYDLYDAVTIRQLLRPDIFGVDELMDEEIEYMRGKLLRYKKQLSELGVNCDRLEKPITNNSIIIRGKPEGGTYGRISLKWMRENLKD